MPFGMNTKNFCQLYSIGNNRAAPQINEYGVPGIHKTLEHVQIINLNLHFAPFFNYRQLKCEVGTTFFVRP